jgi:hypothetical protein
VAETVTTIAVMIRRERRVAERNLFICIRISLLTRQLLKFAKKEEWGGNFLENVHVSSGKV